MPVSGCSPFVSITANLGPKSQNTDLEASRSAWEPNQGSESVSPEKAVYVCRDELDVTGMREVVDLELLRQGRVGQDDHLKLGEVVLRKRSLEDADRHVGVELCESGCRRSVARLANVAFAEEELQDVGVDERKVADSCDRRTHLSAQIRDLGRRRVVDRDRLDASEADVLGCARESVQHCQAALRRHAPISTPSPFMPTIKTLELAIFCMAAGRSDGSASSVRATHCAVLTFMTKDVAEEGSKSKRQYRPSDPSGLVASFLEPSGDGYGQTAPGAPHKASVTSSDASYSQLARVEALVDGPRVHLHRVAARAGRLLHRRHLDYLFDAAFTGVPYATVLCPLYDRLTRCFRGRWMGKEVEMESSELAFVASLNSNRAGASTRSLRPHADVMWSDGE